MLKWCSSHFYTYYVSVVPAVYQHVLYGTTNSPAPLAEYRDYLNEYLGDSPEDTLAAASANPRVHGLFKEPSPNAAAAGILPQCSSGTAEDGTCPNDLYGDRLYAGDDLFASHPKEKSAALFRYNTSYIGNDKRAQYHSTKFPWLRMAAKFEQP